MASIIKKLFRSRPPNAGETSKPGSLSKQQIKQFLPPAPVVIEAGAHVGQDTTEMSRLWPQGKIYAFEPVPEIFAKLKARTDGCPNVKRFPLALAEKSGTVEFNLSSGKSSASSSILSPKQHLEQHPDVKFDRKITVKTITIDDWARENGEIRVDFLWLDLQGYELFALKGARQTLPTVSAIYTEVFLKESYAGAPLYPELRGWLIEQGFTVEWEGLPWPDSGNVLFVRR